MKTIRLFLLVSITLLLILSCKKAVEKFPENKVDDITQPQTNSSNGGGSAYARTNANLLYLVISGQGGYVQGDTASEPGPVDTDAVLFPSYAPPSNVGGMLQFPSTNDYNKFIDATYLMEDLWIYSDIDYEDTPGEIYHLGEEPLNAFDSALGFQSLRYNFELNEFHNYDWADTAEIYVEDDDCQLILNKSHEVKIGNKYFKYLAGNIVAIVNNSNAQALDKVRVFGIFTNDPDVLIYDEEASSYLNPQRIEDPEGTEGCNNFELYGFANNLTNPVPGTTQWTVGLTFSVFFNQGTSQPLPCVMANYQINWGDGTIETFTDRLRSPASRGHVYTQSIAPGGQVVKTISISCQVIETCGDPLIAFNCPTITSLLFSTTTNVILAMPPDPGECLSGNIKRKFYSQEYIIGDKTYRIHCKLKQKSDPVLWFPSAKATVIFEKKKNGRWKKSKPETKLFLKLRGKIYDFGNCNSEFKTMNHEKSTTQAKKIKIKETNVPGGYLSRKSLSQAINADFFWTFNNGQSAVGSYNQVLKP